MATKHDMSEQEQLLRGLAEIASGHHYESQIGQTILSADWADYYPEVDSDGVFTGNIVDADAEGYLNVDDVAMVDADEVRGQRLLDDGYVVL